MVGTSAYMIVFRLIHIWSGPIWVGAARSSWSDTSSRASRPSAQQRAPSSAAVGAAEAARLPPRVGWRDHRRGPVPYWGDWQAAGSLGEFVGAPYAAVLTVGAVLSVSVAAMATARYE
jgi:hypothetical protein